MDSADVLQVVLIAGQFDGAEGFTLSNDGRVATINMKDEIGREQAEQPVTTLRLTWKAPGW